MPLSLFTTHENPHSSLRNPSKARCLSACGYFRSFSGICTSHGRYVMYGELLCPQYSNQLPLLEFYSLFAELYLLVALYSLNVLYLLDVLHLLDVLYLLVVLYVLDVLYQLDVLYLLDALYFLDVLYVLDVLYLLDVLYVLDVLYLLVAVYSLNVLVAAGDSQEFQEVSWPVLIRIFKDYSTGS